MFKMNLTLIVAVSENNVIGFKNKIPWRIKEDMQRFKELTLNHPVIMGRKTYESIPLKFRPLPERKNIVLSRDLNSKAKTGNFCINLPGSQINEDIYIARNIEEALELAENKDSYIIGGEKIYESFLPLVNKIELTKVHNSYEGDAFFPEINWGEWEIINKERKVNNEGINFSFLTYKKKL